METDSACPWPAAVCCDFPRSWGDLRGDVGPWLRKEGDAFICRQSLDCIWSHPKLMMGFSSIFPPPAPLPPPPPQNIFWLTSPLRWDIRADFNDTVFACWQLMELRLCLSDHWSAGHCVGRSAAFLCPVRRADRAPPSVEPPHVGQRSYSLPACKGGSNLGLSHVSASLEVPRARFDGTLGGLMW